jgi:hypothetical protein
VSTTPPANIIIAEDNIGERARPLDDSYENNASDHHGTRNANSGVENSPIIFNYTDEDVVHLNNNTVTAASFPIIDV